MRPAGCSASIRDRSPNHIHTVAVIPARYGSTRFPGKALADLAGRPMIEHVYRRAASARNVDAVVVATDDERIAAAVTAFGGEVRLTRTDHATGTDRLAEAAASIDCDLVVNVQGDEPLIEADVIDAVVEPFAADADLEMATACTPITDAADAANPHVVKVVTDQHGFALYFSRASIPFARGRGARARKHIGLYVYRRDFLRRIAALEPTPLERAESLEQLRVLEHGWRIKVIETRHDSIGVDTPDDLERVRRLVTAGARA